MRQWLDMIWIINLTSSYPKKIFICHFPQPLVTKGKSQTTITMCVRKFLQLKLVN